MSVLKIRELQERRAELVTQSRAILDKASKEKRTRTAEEEATYTAVFADVEKLTRQIGDEERQLEVERAIAAGVVPGEGEGENRDKPKTDTEKRKAAFRQFLMEGMAGLNQDERRALQVGSDTAGGYLAAREEFVQELIQAVDNQVLIRQFATKFTTMAETIGVPTLDTDPDDADWTSELATGSEDSSMAVGRRTLTPHPLAKRIKISNDLLGGGGINAEQLAIDRLSYKFGISEEKGFMTGTGAAQALGVFTASDLGIPTSRDVSTDNTTTEMRFDGLKNAKYSIKGAYWPRLRWVFHRDALKQLSKLKDGEGRYQWEASVQVGQPDRLLNFPLHMSEYAPNTFTTGLYVGVLGDFSKYWIVDSLKLRFQRLIELYAETNQIGLIGRAKVDGMPVLGEAFARVKLA